MTTTDLFGGLAQQTTLAAILASQQSLLAAQPTGYAKDSSLATLHTDLQAVSTGLGPLATQTTLAAVLAKISADPASQTTLAALLAKTTSDPATNTTAAAILAKLSADPATKASVDAVTAALGSVASQTTLAAVLAKMPAAPALDSSLATLHTDIVSGQQHTDLVAITTALGGLATQTTSAAILAKMPTSPALDATVASVRSSVDSLIAKTTADPATQTTLAALLGRTSNDQATNTTLAALLAKTTSDPATATGLANIVSALAPLGTQTTLAAVLAILGLGPTSLLKAEDAAAVIGDRGVALLNVRGANPPSAHTDAPGDYSGAIVDAEGKQVQIVGAIPENTWQATIAMTTATTTAIKAAGGAGIRNYLTDLVLSSGTATAAIVTILDGSTAVGVVHLAASIGATAALSWRTPIRGTPNTALNIQSSAAIALKASGTGYIGV